MKLLNIYLAVILFISLTNISSAHHHLEDSVGYYCPTAKYIISRDSIVSYREAIKFCKDNCATLAKADELLRDMEILTKEYPDLLEAMSFDGSSDLVWTWVQDPAGKGRVIQFSPGKKIGKFIPEEDLSYEYGKTTLIPALCKVHE